MSKLKDVLSGDVSLDEMLDAKVIATTLTALVVGYVVAFAAKYNYEADVSLVTVLLGPPIYAAVSFAVGYIKRDPRVQALVDFYRANGRELEGEREFVAEDPPEGHFPEDARP